MTDKNPDIIGISHLDDRHAGAGSGQVAAGQGESPPETPTEVQLAGIWQAALSGIPVQRESNFIAIGGDSLSLAQVIAELETVYGISPSVESIANNLVLKDMAGMVDKLVAAGGQKH